MNKKLPITAFVISLIALGIAIFVAFSSGQSKSKSEPTVLPTPSVITDTAPASEVTSGVTSEVPTTTESATVTLRDQTLGFTLDYPENWTVTNGDSMVPGKISHTSVILEGPEGKITLSNATGFGGGPCSVYNAENITLELPFGPVSMCHSVESDGTEMWRSSNNGPHPTPTNGLTVDGHEMSVHITAVANPPLSTNSKVVLGILDTFDFIPLQ